MTTNIDFYDALMDGRWQPEIELFEDKNTFGARYVQGDKVVEKTSHFDFQDAQNQLHDELRRGTLEGEYYPLMG